MTRVARLMVGLTLVAGCSGQGPPPSAVESPAMAIDPAEASRAGELRADNAPAIPFRRCPPGSFRMGGGRGSVGVTLSRPYWIGQDEVTQDQWLRLMGTTLREQRARDPDQPRPVGDGSTRDHVGDGADRPIYFVSHSEATEFSGG